MLLVYKSLIFPSIIYCQSLWGLTRKMCINKVYIAQKKYHQSHKKSFFTRSYNANFPTKQAVKYKLIIMKHMYLRLDINIYIYIYIYMLLLYKFMFCHIEMIWFIPYINTMYNTRFSNENNLCTPRIRTSHSKQSTTLWSLVLLIGTLFQ